VRAHAELFLRDAAQITTKLTMNSRKPSFLGLPPTKWGALSDDGVSPSVRLSVCPTPKVENGECYSCGYCRTLIGNQC